MNDIWKNTGNVLWMGDVGVVMYGEVMPLRWPERRIATGHSGLREILTH